jgi:PAS domain-containing protein
MSSRLPRTHRLARIDYPPRAAAFALTFVVVCALFAEHGFAAWELVFAVLCFLVYPHLAYLHARSAPDPKQAELNNLYLDSVVMGIWAVQIHFALWPTAMCLSAIILNNAANGGIRQQFWAGLWSAAAAVAWGALFGYRFNPDTGPLVTGICVFGGFAYVSWVGTIMYTQNRALLRAQHRAQDSEKQFQFVAETQGELVCVLGKDGRILYASSSHERYFDPAVLGTGSIWLGLVHPGDHEQARQFLDRIAITQARQQTRLRMNSGEGSLRMAECHGNPVTDHRGVMTAMVVVTRRASLGVVSNEPGLRDPAPIA